MNTPQTRTAEPKAAKPKPKRARKAAATKAAKPKAAKAPKTAKPKAEAPAEWVDLKAIAGTLKTNPQVVRGVQIGMRVKGLRGPRNSIAVSPEDRDRIVTRYRQAVPAS